MELTTAFLTQIFTNYKGDIKKDQKVNHTMTDSRIKKNNALFIPIVGDQFDAHNYLEQAIANGAISTIWQKDKRLPRSLPDEFPIYFVEDTLKALQDLAKAYRERINPTVIGITGSNGKTTTKDFLTSVLATSYQTHATEGNYNNHIGLPLTILAMSPNTEMLVLEMGMNHFHEIDQLSKIAHPDYAIITNIGESHIEYLGSRKGISEAKLEIINGLKENGRLIIDGDEVLLTSRRFKSMVTCGFRKNNDWQIADVRVSHENTKFTLKHHEKTEFTIPILGNHHALNAAYAIILGHLLQISNEKIQKGLTSLTLTAMRFEISKGRNGVSVVNDAYNASPTSMKAAINIIKQMNGYKEKVLILGDIFELGTFSEEMHRSIADDIDSSITVVYTYGEKAKLITEEITKHYKDIECKHFVTREECIQALNKYLHPEAILLFKASRGMEFEKMIEKIM